MNRWRIDAWGLTAALVLLAAALAAPLLGLADWQPAVVAGAAAAGLVYAVCRALSLAPLLQRASAEGRRPSPIFLLLPLGLYLALIPWSMHARAPDGDEPWFLLVTHSIAHDFDLDLSNNYREEHSRSFMPRAIEPQPGDPERTDGTIRSRHGAVLQTLMAPAYRVAGRAGAMVVVAVLAALGAWLLLDLTAFSHDARARLAAWIIFTFGAPFLLYSQQIWAEVMAVALAVLGYWSICRLTADRSAAERDGPPGVAPGSGSESRHWRLWVLLALSLALLPALKLRLVLVSAALALILVARLAPRRRRVGLVVLGAVGLPAALLVLASNRAVFGTVLGMHSWGELEIWGQPARIALGLNGLAFDLAYGLAASAPVWLLLFPAALVCWKRNRRLLFEVALLAGPTLLLVASRREWYGGWSPPFRYGLVVLPFLALLLVPLFERPGEQSVDASGSAASRPATGVAAVATVLALLSGALLVLLVAEPGWTYNLADGRHQFLHHLEARTGLDLGRFLPSASRPRAATWILPALAALAVSAAAMARRRAAANVLATLPALFLAALPVLADTVPTRRVELESAAVQRTAGNREPARWTMDRTRFPEAWVLPEGTKATAPVVAGGPAVALAVRLRAIHNRPATLTLVARSGDHELGRLRLEPEGTAGWHTLTLAAAPWTEGAPLVLEVPPGGEAQQADAGTQNGIAIDRVDLRWE